MEGKRVLVAMSGGVDSSAAALLLLFNDDAAARALRARLPHDVDEAQQRLSPGEEIVQDEHSVLRAEKFFG